MPLGLKAGGAFVTECCVLRREERLLVVGLDALVAEGTLSEQRALLSAVRAEG